MSNYEHIKFGIGFRITDSDLHDAVKLPELLRTSAMETFRKDAIDVLEGRSIEGWEGSSDE